MTSSLISLIKEIVDSIKDSDIKALTIDIVSNPKLSFTSIKPLIELTESPAAPRKHHMFSGGLIIHTVSVVKIALALCKIFEEIYGVEINRDLVIAASILHDIYKYYQYDRDALNGGYKPRDDWYLSHDYAIVAEVAKRGGGDNIIRVLSEVHGIAPITTFEGLVVHLADSIDAKFGEYIQNEVISEIKNLEVESKGCKPIELFDIAIKKFGIHKVFRYAKDNAKLYELFNELCNEVASKGK